MTPRSSTLVSGCAVALLALSALAAPGVAAGSTSDPAVTVTPEGPAAKVDWPQFHRGPTHRGYNRHEDVVNKDNVHMLSLSWLGNGATFGEDLVFKSSPTLVDGFIYFGTEQGRLLAFRDTCGSDQCEPAWEVALGESIYNAPAVVDGTLYVGTASPLGALYAFDVDACATGTCTPLWKSKPLAVGTSSPTVVDGVVYVGSQSTGLYAFSADGCGHAKCDPLWVGQTGGYVLGSPAVADGVVYIGSESGDLLAFDADGCGQATCQPTWRGPVSGPIYDSSPVVWRGRVFVTSFDDSPNSFLYAFDADGCGDTECDPLWRGTGGHYLNVTPAIAYGHVYLGSGDGRVLAYPARGCGNPTCSPSWTYDAAGPVATSESPPMIANGVVYVGENNGRVYAYPARCHQFQCDKLWEHLTQDPLVNSSPLMANGTLYLAGTNFGSVPLLYVFEL